MTPAKAAQETPAFEVEARTSVVFLLLQLMESKVPKDAQQQTIRLIIPPEFSPNSEVKTPELLRANKAFGSRLTSPAALSKYGEVIEISVNPNITASELCARVVANAKYKPASSSSETPQLQVHLMQVRGGSFENILDPDDLPLQVLEMLDSSGRSAEFEFVLKKSRPGVPRGITKRSDAMIKLHTDAAGAIRSGLLEIYMEKMQRWKTRWFVLQDDRLYYYRSHLDLNPLSFIPLRNSAIRVISDLNVQKRNRRKSWSDYKDIGRPNDPAEDRKARFCIEIDTATSLFHLVAPSLPEMEAWINDIIVQSDAHQINFHFEDLACKLENQELQKANFVTFQELWQRDERRCRELISSFSNGQQLCLLWEAVKCKRVEASSFSEAKLDSKESVQFDLAIVSSLMISAGYFRWTADELVLAIAGKTDRPGVVSHEFYDLESDLTSHLLALCQSLLPAAEDFSASLRISMSASSRIEELDERFILSNPSQISFCKEDIVDAINSRYFLDCQQRQ
eukprot:TRINITY_DN6581_c0_g2_i2.p1 TRINITY_DN6581_c0_g2~~TRINITY_DN6581_c0_g2_i2.p1  ORF type:complete len:510 (-),score=98.31 TRINITY_DN6581_c0_g2_i2:232-1761(-)